MFPKVPATAMLERLGINAVAFAPIQLNLIWRETMVSDVGVDGHLEFVDERNSATGRTVGVQVNVVSPTSIPWMPMVGDFEQTRNTQIIGSTIRYL